MKVDITVFAVLALIISVNAYKLQDVSSEQEVNGDFDVMNLFDGLKNLAESQLTAFYVNQLSPNISQNSCYVENALEVHNIIMKGADKIRGCYRKHHIGPCVHHEIEKIRHRLAIASEQRNICLEELDADLSGQCAKQPGNSSICATISCWVGFVQDVFYIGAEGIEGIERCVHFHPPKGGKRHEDFCIQHELLRTSTAINFESINLALCLTHVAISLPQPTPPNNTTTTPSYTTISPSWNTTTSYWNTTVPEWSSNATRPSNTTEENKTTTPFWNTTIPEWSSTATPLLNTTEEYSTSTEANSSGLTDTTTETETTLAPYESSTGGSSDSTDSSAQTETTEATDTTVTHTEEPSKGSTESTDTTEGSKDLP